jgi:cobalt-zinc-cadmium efflux system membrane fusion protein
VLAYPGRAFAAKVVSVGTTLDPTTRRLQVRAEVDNPDLILKPDMFASFTIAVGAGIDSPAVPSRAIVFEGDSARVWVQTAENRFASRRIEVGMQDERIVQILAGLRDGEKVVTRGSLFIDRSANPD